MSPWRLFATAAVVPLLMLCATGSARAADAPGKSSSAKSAKPKKVEKTFAQRLADKEIVFTNLAFPPPPANWQVHEGRLIDEPMLVGAVRDVLQKLLNAHAHYGGPVAALPFGVIESNDFNCSVPANGAHLLCTSGAIRTVMESGGPKKGMDQLAFLVAHELAHVTIASHRKRFENGEKLKNNWQAIGVIGALGAVAAISDFKSANGKLSVDTPVNAGIYFWNVAIAGVDMGALVENLLAPSWGQDDEDEADAYALILVKDAGYDPAQAAPLLKSVEMRLLEQKQGGTVIGSMLKEGAKSAALRALLTKGDKLSTIIGGVTGALKGMTAATAHYHRAPGKRADTCAAIAMTMVDTDLAARERMALANEPVPGTPGAANVQLASYTQPAPAAVASPKAAASKKKAGKASKSAKAAKTPPAPPKSYWERFVEQDWRFGELDTDGSVRAKILEQDFKGALALCPKTMHLPSLRLSCAMANIGAKNDAAAKPLIQQAIASPDATAEDLRLAARLQAAMGDQVAALKTIMQGRTRFPDGSLYPDEMMIRVTSGDVEGAKATGKTCQQQTEGSIKEACTKALDALSKNVTT